MEQKQTDEISDVIDEQSSELVLAHTSEPTPEQSTTLCISNQKRKFRRICFSIVAAIWVVLIIIIPTATILSKKVNLTTITPTLVITINATSITTLTTTITSTTTIITTTTTTECIFTDERIYSGDLKNLGRITPITTADVNGDNKTDIIGAIYGAGKIAILINTGNGTFYPQMNYVITTYYQVSFITTADLDGDNKVDMIISHQSPPAIGVFINTGTGTFNPAENYETGTGSNPDSIATADFDGDKKLDIVVTDLNKNRIRIFFNTGIGTFYPQIFFSTGFNSKPVFVTTDDMNGDNKPDIIVANSVTNNIAIFFNTGNDTFNSQITYLTGTNTYPNFVTTVDFDGDNKLDIVVANEATKNIIVLFNTGQGTFNRRESYFTDSYLRRCFIAAAHFNTNNKIDIIFINPSTYHLGILYNTDNTTFYHPLIYRMHAGTGLTCITIADVNTDNKSDLIFSDNYGNVIVLLSCLK